MNIIGTNYLPTCYPVNPQHSPFKHVFSIRLENSVDPDQLASEEASWSRSTMCQKRINPGPAGQGLRLQHEKEIGHTTNR